jgi:Rhodanese-like domain
MAKQRHQQTQPNSKTPLIALAIGGLLVAALVVWALTRTVENPATASIDAPSNQTQTFPTASTETTTLPPTGTGGFASPTTSSPMATTSSPIVPPAPAAQTADKAAVKRISAEDLKQKVDSGQAIVIDVRDANSYAAAHIKGALHIPMASVQANLDRLPKEKDVVAYCT